MYVVAEHRCWPDSNTEAFCRKVMRASERHTAHLDMLGAEVLWSSQVSQGAEEGGAPMEAGVNAPLHDVVELLALL